MNCPSNDFILKLSLILFNRIDRTFKLYIGGKQKRPDANYSRPITDASGKVIAQVGESNRKDVRDAVDIAAKTLPR